MFVIEFALVLLAVVLAFVFPDAGARYFSWAEERFASIARRRVLAVLLVGLTALVLRAALLPILPIPDPAVDDEFSYLLAADTFSHGRLTNPTHPMWIHFEAPGVIQQPTYASKYPPAQGFMLAAGEVIGGHPFWGVWFSLGLMCSAICWALQAWFDEAWALFGGLLAVFHFAIFSYWANSYWGGAVAASGGALVFGALPRIKQSQRIRDALLMAVGLGVLANSRPYEGLVFSVPIAAALAFWVLRGNRPPLRLVAKRVVAPVFILLVVAACGMGYYFWRVTGNPLRMPYRVFQDTYDPAPYFVWQSPGPLPAFRHQTIKDWERNQLALSSMMHTAFGFVVQGTVRLVDIWLFFLGPLLALPLLLSFATLPPGFQWRDISRQTRFLLVAATVCLAGALVEIPFFPHYSAPATALIFAVILAATQSVRNWKWRGQPVGASVVRSIPVALGLLFIIRVSVGPVNVGPFSPWLWSAPTSNLLGRASVVSELHRYPGPHLVLVRYAPDHVRPLTTPVEWVYNSADIDASGIAWAEDMGSVANEELIRYYKDRTIWLVDVDEKPPKLSPYADSSISTQSARAGR